MTETAILLAAIAFLLGALLGLTVGRGRRDRALDDAADRSLALLRSRQLADDREAVRHLPPTVSLSDALEHAGRMGIGVAEAADDLYRRRVRALLARETRRSIHKLRADRHEARP